jgi:hypothetical protein
MLLGFSTLAKHMQVNAQFIPIPPPSPDIKKIDKSTKVNNDDHEPPIIEVITTELKQGKNVFKVKITDTSSIELKEIRYVQQGYIKTTGLFRDQNNVYKALIDIQPPSRVIVINAGDMLGNEATIIKEFEIIPSENIFTQIINILSKLFQGY